MYNKYIGNMGEIDMAWLDKLRLNLHTQAEIENENSSLVLQKIQDEVHNTMEQIHGSIMKAAQNGNYMINSNNEKIIECVVFAPVRYLHKEYIDNNPLSNGTFDSVSMRMVGKSPKEARRIFKEYKKINEPRVDRSQVYFFDCIRIKSRI